MRWRLSLPLLCLAIALPPQAANAERIHAKRPAPCSKTAASGYEITQCAAQDYRKADQRLNRAYRDLLRYLDPAQREQLLAVQKAWIAFRDADCTFFRADASDLAPANDLYCRAALSNDRAKELDGWPPNAPRSALQPYNPEH